MEGQGTRERTTARILSSSERAGLGRGGKKVRSLGSKRWDRDEEVKSGSSEPAVETLRGHSSQDVSNS